MSIINEKFEHVYVINLKEGEEALTRRTAIDELFTRLGIDYELFEAIDGSKLDVEIEVVPGKRWNKGAYGLALTTMNILEDAKTKGYKNILIFEDDVEEFPLFEIYVDEILNTIPKKYDLFFLGYTLKKEGSPALVYEDGVRVFLPHLKTMTDGFSCHAYAVNAHMYDFYKNLISTLDQPIDVHTNTIMSRQNSYYTIQKLFHQKSGYSFIQGSDYDTSFTR